MTRERFGALMEVLNGGAASGFKEVFSSPLSTAMRKVFEKLDMPLKSGTNATGGGTVNPGVVRKTVSKLIEKCSNVKMSELKEGEKHPLQTLFIDSGATVNDMKTYAEASRERRGVDVATINDQVNAVLYLTLEGVLDDGSETATVSLDEGAGMIELSDDELVELDEIDDDDDEETERKAFNDMMAVLESGGAVLHFTGAQVGILRVATSFGAVKALNRDTREGLGTVAGTTRDGTEFRSLVQPEGIRVHSVVMKSALDVLHSIAQENALVEKHFKSRMKTGVEGRKGSFIADLDAEAILCEAAIEGTLVAIPEAMGLAPLLAFAKGAPFSEPSIPWSAVFKGATGPAPKGEQTLLSAKEGAEALKRYSF